MNRRLAAAGLATAVIFAVGQLASGQEASPISKTQLQKLLKFVDTLGAQEEFPGPTAQNLGFTDQPFLTLRVQSVVTSDHHVYFCRSELNPEDYVVWAVNGNTSYLFSTHADFKLIRAVHLDEHNVQRLEDSKSAKIQAAYIEALRDLAKDVSTSPSP